MKKSLLYCRKKNSFPVSKFYYSLKLFSFPVFFVILISGCDYFFPPLSGEKLPLEEAARYITKNKDNPDVVILDVRTKPEFDSVRIDGSMNLDFSMPDFPEMISKLDKDKRYIIIDENGKKSAMTTELMKEERFTKVHFISGGMDEWVMQNYPVNTKK